MSSGQAGPESGDNDPYTDPGAKFGRLELPKLNTSSIDLGSLAGMYGVQGGGAYEPDYLDYNIKGRDTFEKTTYNTGMCYLAGIIGGGGYGVLEGARTAPSSRARIRVNAILNAAGKRGSRAGNTLAVLAMFYTGFEFMFDSLEVDAKVGDAEWLHPVLAGSAAMTLFYTGKNVRTMALAGVAGGAGMGALYLGTTALGSLIGANRRRP
ncbi:mitochondrial import inner membrane translocase subunit TIM23 [Tribonema minus]|uniref:Mitochondrial import inner membrane translocase subunit TIM23 n=1 Tax=Tribonema minus TaxID=303371 RepID=A0A835Z638_9STRA|nr:mitochondrial import inner membrane translocase subunit TIM23 [Tribonema minus]